LTKERRAEMQNEKQKMGLIGLAVMGQNLALNIESKGFPIAVFNRTSSRTEEFAKGTASGKKVLPTYSIEELVNSLEKPRRIMLMVKAGKAVDDFVRKLLPHLDKGDLIIDGGNSFFGDTIRRNRNLTDKGVLYIGTGVSGGEEGALHGPAIMPGGQKEAYDLIAPIFSKIAAQVDNEPCCTYIGSDGAGHYVKMVHNGIEYGDMQLITEAYVIMKNTLGMSAEELHQVFSEWNHGELSSYLIEITADIFLKVDEDTGNPLVEMILDRAGQKGTGKWTSQSALDMGIPAPTIAEAVFARCISALKEQRVEASKLLPGPELKFEGNREEFVSAICKALYASKICSYAQGFALMQEASKEHNWNLRLGEIAMIWRGGCIIRAQFLHRIKEAFDHNPELNNLLLAPYFKEVVEKSQSAWREVVSTSANLGIPIPAFSSALCYYDSYRQEKLGANLIQAQRDYFGAHTYQRIDKEGTFHTEWQ
jgi:6-phosphogluconate dehydrogenase